MLPENYFNHTLPVSSSLKSTPRYEKYKLEYSKLQEFVNSELNKIGNAVYEERFRERNEKEELRKSMRFEYDLVEENGWMKIKISPVIEKDLEVYSKLGIYLKSVYSRGFVILEGRLFLKNRNGMYVRIPYLDENEGEELSEDDCRRFMDGIVPDECVVEGYEEVD